MVRCVARKRALIAAVLTLLLGGGDIAAFSSLHWLNYSTASTFNLVTVKISYNFGLIRKETLFL